MNRLERFDLYETYKTGGWKSRAFFGCCGLTCLALSATYCGLYWAMWNEASEYSLKMELTGYKGEIPAYDTCGDTEGKTNTRWSVIFAFNAILYLLMTISAVLMFLSVFEPKLWILASCGPVCGPFAMLACLATTASLRFHIDSKECASDGAEMFKEHAQ